MVSRRRAIAVGALAVCALAVAAAIGLLIRSTGLPSPPATDSVPSSADPPSESRGRSVGRPPGLVLADTSLAGPGPRQLSSALVGSAVPTNQWWTSALVGPGTEPLWAAPIVAQVIDSGLAIGASTTRAERDLIVADRTPPFLLGARAQTEIDNPVPVRSTEVLGFGPFSVRLGVDFADGTRLEVSMAQGSPAVWVEIVSGEASLTSPADHDPRQTMPGRTRLDGPLVDWTIGGALDNARRHGDGRSSWTIADGQTVTFILRPEDAPANWSEAEDALVDRPIVDTWATRRIDYSTGAVIHELGWVREPDGAGPVALLPHHWATSTSGDPLGGHYANPRGRQRLVNARSIEARLPISGFIGGVPDVLELDDKAWVAEVLEGSVDLGSGGSYWGPKLLGRAATLSEIADAVGKPAVAAALRAQIRERLVDWLTHDGPEDQRWVGFDERWGGVVAFPPEYGNELFNDHHFHYGYLLQAAATVGAADPGFVASHGPVVDLLADDLTGADGQHLPAFRVFNAYLGHSYASGLAPFADGNNQESSSEAVHAWWAATRWAQLRGDQSRADDALALYVLEADAASRYWLGATGEERPSGYAHNVAGIVWDGKIDFATWFDPSPASVIGIQLLPFSFGSLYRDDPAAARQRVASVATDRTGLASRWPDLFLMDLATVEPGRARELLEANPGIAIEEGNSAGLLRYWIAALAQLGVPDPSVRIAEGQGATFVNSSGQRTLVAFNPAASPGDVTFLTDDGLLAVVPVGPRATVIHRP